MWQQFLDENGDPRRIAFLSVAVDADPRRPRPFAEWQPFTTVLDSAGVLGRLFDFDVVPNGLFLDEEGVIRYLHVGGFDIRRPEIAQQVEALLRADFAAGDVPHYVAQEPLDVELLRTELVDRPESADLHLALADALLREGRAAEAEQAYRRAAELNPADWSAPFGVGA